MRQWIRKYSWTPACNSELKNTPGHPRVTVNKKIHLDTCVRQRSRKYSWTPSWTVNMKILLDTRVTVTFLRAFQPSAGLSYWKIGTRQMCMKWLLNLRHVNSVKQCQQCRTVSTVSTVSTVIAQWYLHLRWYFCFWNTCPNNETTPSAGKTLSEDSVRGRPRAGWCCTGPHGKISSADGTDND